MDGVSGEAVRLRRFLEMTLATAEMGRRFYLANRYCIEAAQRD